MTTRYAPSMNLVSTDMPQISHKPARHSHSPSALSSTASLFSTPASSVFSSPETTPDYYYHPPPSLRSAEASFQTLSSGGYKSFTREGSSDRSGNTSSSSSDNTQRGRARKDGSKDHHRDKERDRQDGDRDGKPTKVRQRTAIACNYCRRRKVSSSAFSSRSNLTPL